MCSKTARSPMVGLIIEKAISVDIFDVYLCHRLHRLSLVLKGRRYILTGLPRFKLMAREG